MNEAVEMLLGFGWNVETRQPATLRLPLCITVRYPRSPAEYIQFLEQVGRCSNAAETVWFLMEEDFVGTADLAFRWNEFEMLSLEAAENDDDLVKAITQFWDRHLPIALSTKNGYAFLALSLIKEDYGRVMMGREPEFEDVEAVCNSFLELLPLLVTTAHTADIGSLADFS